MYLFADYYYIHVYVGRGHLVHVLLRGALQGWRTTLQVLTTHVLDSPSVRCRCSRCIDAVTVVQRCSEYMHTYSEAQVVFFRWCQSLKCALVYLSRIRTGCAD